MAPFILLYIFLFLVWVFTRSISNKKRRRIYQCVWAGIGLIFILGFHSPEQGVDVCNAYIPLFHHVDGTFSFEQYLGFEPMFYNYVSLIKRYTDQEQFFLLITACLIVIPILLFFYKQSANPMLSVIFYVSWVLFYFSFSGIRQAMAVSIVTIAYIFLFQKKNIAFAVIVIGASLIHTSALLSLIALPLFYLKIKDAKWFTIFVSFALITLILPNILVKIVDIIFSDSGRYQNQLEDLRGGGYTLSLVYFFFACVVSYFNKKTKNCSYVQFLLLLFTIQMLGMRSDVATRIGYYFLPLLFVFYPNAIEQSKHSEIVEFVSCILFISFFFYVNSSGYLDVLPLKMCWE